MVKVGEHITIDFLGVKKDYTPEFYEKCKISFSIALQMKMKIFPSSGKKQRFLNTDPIEQ